MTCYRCDKIIKGKVIKHISTNCSIGLGIDFIKYFHFKCYELEEKEAKKELHKEN